METNDFGERLFYLRLICCNCFVNQHRIIPIHIHFVFVCLFSNRYVQHGDQPDGNRDDHGVHDVLVEHELEQFLSRELELLGELGILHLGKLDMVYQLEL